MNVDGDIFVVVWVISWIWCSLWIGCLSVVIGSRIVVEIEVYLVGLCGRLSFEYEVFYFEKYIGF